MGISIETLALAKKSCEGKTVDANDVVIKAANSYADKKMEEANEYASVLVNTLIGVDDDNNGNVMITIRGDSDAK